MLAQGQRRPRRATGAAVLAVAQAHPDHVPTAVTPSDGPVPGPTGREIEDQRPQVVGDRRPSPFGRDRSSVADASSARQLRPARRTSHRRRRGGSRRQRRRAASGRLAQPDIEQVDQVVAGRHAAPRARGPRHRPGQPVGQEDVDQLGLAGDTDRQAAHEGRAPRAGRAALAVSERQPGGDERRLRHPRVARRRAPGQSGPCRATTSRQRWRGSAGGLRRAVDPRLLV